MSGAGRAATPALARRHEVTADSGATHTIAEEERMTKRNDIISRIERQYAARGLDPQRDLQPWLDALREVDVDAEAMVARAEAEAHPLGLTVIEGGGGGSPPTSTPPRGSPPPATPPAAA